MLEFANEISGPGISFVERFLTTNSISLILIRLLGFWFVCLYVIRVSLKSLCLLMIVPFYLSCQFADIELFVVFPYNLFNFCESLSNWKCSRNTRMCGHPIYKICGMGKMVDGNLCTLCTF